VKTDKGQTLLRLHRAGFPVPPFFMVSPYEALVDADIQQRCLRLAGGADGASFAVRSSAQAEDGHAASYAGMFETFLFVTPTDVTDRVRRVRESGSAECVRAYDAMQGNDRREHAPSTIVQLMVDADISGVAFGRDPVDGSDRAVIVAAYGLGSAVVAGESDTDTYRVAQSGDIVERHIVHKTVAHRRAPTISGVQSVEVAPAVADSPALCDEELLKVVEMLRAIEACLGDAQDVEWAISGGRLFVLQSRPITTAAGTIWDNSNIAESYGGLVSPLTFSFARYAYAAAYRELMRVFGIDRKTIDAHGDALQEMLGLVGGHMYYNLLNWYRLLALIPGFRLNRRFMEGMMGVREPLPQSLLDEISRKGKARDLFAVIKMLFALSYRLARLRRDTALFHRRTAAALAASPRLQDLDARELLAEFSRLEAELLVNWRAPLVNDFFAMVFYGTLRALSARWFAADADRSLSNDLLCAAGGMVSTEPADRIAQLAGLVRGDEALTAAVEAGDVELAVKALRTRPRAFEAFNAYLERFGDRCPNELKLESSTLHQNPLPLLQAIVRVATEERGSQAPVDHATSVRRSAEQRVSRVLRGHPLRFMMYSFVVDNARCRIRERENLRLERTRVFARVREIMLELGLRLHAHGVLDDPRDVLLIELQELRAAIATHDHPHDLRRLAGERRAVYAGYATLPAPPDRFCAIGATAPPAAQSSLEPDGASSRSGIGCCPGTVRARVRLVKDARSYIESGEILVAERTDPGWIVLFPAAAGILVERGSLLSHAAIVSRELGIPSVVGLAGLMQWLRDGDIVELDGRSGIVRRLTLAMNP
jgi:phosphohistidine swiveling domain-containing protein